jgi:hypothetical protein
VYKIVAAQATQASYKAYQYAKNQHPTVVLTFFLEQWWRTRGISSRRADLRGMKTAAGTGQAVIVISGITVIHNFVLRLSVHCAVSSNHHLTSALGERACTISFSLVLCCPSANLLKGSARESIRHPRPQSMPFFTGLLRIYLFI